MSDSNTQRASRPLALFVDRIDDASGGAERFVAAIATALRQRGRDVLLITSRGSSGALIDEATAAGVVHVDLGRTSKWDLWRLFRIVPLLRRHHIAVLHTHKFGSNLPGVLLGRLSGLRRVIAHEHTWSYEGHLFRRLCDRYIIGRLATTFVAVSCADATKMVSVEKVPARRVTVVPTAFTPRAARCEGPALRDELNVGEDTPIVLIGVKLRPVKAVEVLIEAFVRLRHDVPAAHLVIAGDGPEEQRLKDLVTDLGLNDAVHFLGYREDIVRLIDSATVCALVSDVEGLPLWVLETMHGSRPLVATRVGGVPEAVEDGVTGLLVPPRDPDAVAAALTSLLEDPDRRVAMGAAAHARVVAEFSLDAVLDQLEVLYDATNG